MIRQEDATLGEMEAEYRRYFPVLRRKCDRMLTDAQEAQDVAQETLLRMWQADLGNAEPKQIAAWLYRTSTRLAIDRMRKRRHLVSTDQELVSEEGSSNQWSQSTMEAREILSQVVEAVPQKEMEAALLHRVDKMTYAQVADVLEVSHRTARRLLERFDRRLAKLGLESA